MSYLMAFGREGEREREREKRLREKEGGRRKKRIEITLQQVSTPRTIYQQL